MIDIRNPNLGIYWFPAGWADVALKPLGVARAFYSIGREGREAEAFHELITALKLIMGDLNQVVGRPPGVGLVFGKILLRCENNRPRPGGISFYRGLCQPLQRVPMQLRYSPWLMKGARECRRASLIDLNGIRAPQQASELDGLDRPFLRHISGSAARLAQFVFEIGAVPMMARGDISDDRAKVFSQLAIVD